MLVVKLRYALNSITRIMALEEEQVPILTTLENTVYDIFSATRRSIGNQ